jgi:uncharacterized UBP type Zn finger protein
LELSKLNLGLFGEPSKILVAGDHGTSWSIQWKFTIEIQCKQSFVSIKFHRLDFCRYEKQLEMVMEQSKNPKNNVPMNYGAQNIAGVTDEDQMINEALMASISQN